MEDDIISIKGLSRNFKVFRRDSSGFLASVKYLFKREYINIDAVSNVSLTVKKGEIRGLIGPNGAGKSTTIKMLSGVLYPSSGDITVMGFKPWLQREKYVKKIGVVFGQKSQLVWDLPAIDTFFLNREMYNIPQEVFEKNLNYFEEILGISELIKKPVRQLSLGERMKCEFVCAMLHEPPLIFLDEPTIGLDLIAKESLRNFIKSVNRDLNTTFILTTHDIDDIEDLCHNVTIINKGTIVFNDTLDKIRTYYSMKKIVKVKFTHTVSPQLLERFNVLKSDGLSAEFEIRLETTDIKSEVYRIFESLPVHDIDISNIKIEEVIKEIYSM